MSKLERFLQHGNTAVVLRHLDRMKKPENIAQATFHESHLVSHAALEKLGKMGSRAHPAIKSLIIQGLFSPVEGYAQDRYVRILYLSLIGDNARKIASQMLNQERHPLKRKLLKLYIKEIEKLKIIRRREKSYEKLIAKERSRR
ncbi:MAG TPA: hypothetical protein VGQ00_00265 [Candidatus Norongarragalinales archaeon]|jgi:hypothetical protein|nr:hypothetical protein [Candidatus Norongarragalinales archaeon]